jgi:hypothetical protein
MAAVVAHGDGLVRYEWAYGPGLGWGLRRRVRRTKRELNQQGYSVMFCMVARQYKLLRLGAVPIGAQRRKDRLGLGAVLAAERGQRPGPDPAGVREPRRPNPDPRAGAATVD